MILVAVLLVLDSRGPVIFSQMRVGLNGSLFRMYKFRSMFKNAQQEGPHFTSPSDTRVTRVGKIHPQNQPRRIASIIERIFWKHESCWT